jgi:beta-lactamase class A
MWIHSLAIAASLTAAPASNSATKSLDQQLQTMLRDFQGRVGVCIKTLDSAAVCVNRDEKFPLQSVMKMVVGAAVLDLIDQKKFKLSTRIEVSAADASPGPQEFADLLAKKGGLSVTIEELIRRSIVDSDSTSVDVLLQHIGGISVVQEFLKKKTLDGISIDRNERDVQSDFSGIKWKSEYAAAKKFDQAVNAVPRAKRDEALAVYSKDPRDTATPLGMVNFLERLHKGELLSPSSTQKLISIMESTATGLDRLKAGIPKDWKIAHKTGTSAKWNGVTAATNDVGLLLGPAGQVVSIAVFVADSKATNEERAAVIAQSATLASRSSVK